MTFDGPESRWYRLVILCNRGARPHLLSATGGCRALRGEGQPCPRKPTICPTKSIFSSVPIPDLASGGQKQRQQNDFLVIHLFEITSRAALPDGRAVDSQDAATGETSAYRNPICAIFGREATARPKIVVSPGRVSKETPSVHW